MLHLEFTVLGPPVSYQTKDKANLKAWKQKVGIEAGKKCTTPPLTTKLKMTLINFHDGVNAPMDDDNMVKPIRDAMNKLVYEDDRQITYSILIQVGIDAPVKVRKGPAVLFDAFRTGKEFVYIRIEDAPDFIQLPQ